MSYYFVIVGTRDNPIYEAELGSSARVDGGIKSNDLKHLNQFIVHAALDVLEELMWGTNSMYLKVVDKFNEWYISGYVTASNQRLMLLHDTRNDDGIKNFFQETHELFIKVMLNPFYEINSPINSSSFDSKVRGIAKRYL